MKGYNFYKFVDELLNNQKYQEYGQCSEKGGREIEAKRQFKGQERKDFSKNYIQGMITRTTKI